MRQVLILAPFYRCASGGLERLSFLLKAKFCEQMAEAGLEAGSK